MNRPRRIFFPILLALLVTPAALAEKWAWCGTSETAPTGQRVTIYYSDAFEEKDGASLHDYIEGFGSYVRAHYDASRAVGQCRTGYSSKSEASSARDEGAATVKSRGNEVVFTSWTY